MVDKFQGQEILWKRKNYSVHFDNAAMVEYALDRVMLGWRKKSRGPESKTGEDNQVIAVAGGEGILPKDVMEVPGVPELVKSLIQKYHQPVN